MSDCVPAARARAEQGQYLENQVDRYLRLAEQDAAQKAASHLQLSVGEAFLTFVNGDKKSVPFVKVRLPLVSSRVAQWPTAARRACSC